VRVIGEGKRVLGQGHPHTLPSMGNLAKTYTQQGRWKEAEELQAQVMEMGKRVLGYEYPFTLTNMGNLACINIHLPRAVEGGRGAGSTGYGDEEASARRGAPRYLNQHS
jgi:hypothetical protein